MKRKKSKIDELRGKLMGLEMALQMLEDDLDTINANLAYLEKLRKDLVYNINLHRSGKVITVVTEYKKSIDELEVVRAEIVKFQNHKDTVKKSMAKKLKTYDYYFTDYVEEVDRAQRQPKILLFRKEKKT